MFFSACLLHRLVSLSIAEKEKACCNLRKNQIIPASFGFPKDGGELMDFGRLEGHEKEYDLLRLGNLPKHLCVQVTSQALWFRSLSKPDHADVGHGVSTWRLRWEEGRDFLFDSSAQRSSASCTHAHLTTGRGDAHHATAKIPNCACTELEVIVRLQPPPS